MKKIALIGITGLIVVVAIGGFIAFQTMAAKEEPKKTVEVSPKIAKSLQQKIDAIKKAEEDPKHDNGTHIEVSDSELESYLLFSLKEEIPVQVDSADVQLEPDTVSLDTQVTFSSNATGNPVFDALVGGTHNLFVKGKFVAQDNRGKFDLQDVRVDGIPVPNVLIQALLKKYVNPKYPEVDINQPFEMPWGIKDLKIDTGKAAVTY
jgi:hypothetical protein